MILAGFKTYNLLTVCEYVSVCVCAGETPPPSMILTNLSRPLGLRCACMIFCTKIAGSACLIHLTPEPTTARGTYTFPDSYAAPCTQEPLLLVYWRLHGFIIIGLSNISQFLKCPHDGSLWKSKALQIKK